MSETHRLVASHVHLDWGVRIGDHKHPHSDRDRTRNFLVIGQHSNQLSHSGQYASLVLVAEYRDPPLFG